MRELLWQAMRSSLVSFCQYPQLFQELSALERKAELHLLAMGKAAWQMAAVAQAALKAQSLATCTILTKYGFYPPAAKALHPCTILEAGHPVPDANSIKHSQAIVQQISRIPASEDLIILLSGGSSALFEIPVAESSLADIVALNRLLLHSGLDIRQMNLKRRELSQVKGGKALNFVQCHLRGVYLLSDVEADDPATIGSGPFYTAELANHRVIANNLGFLKALRHRLRKSYPGTVRISSRFINLELSQFAHALKRFAATAQPGIFIWGGECRFKSQGEGQGGRCSHLALLMADAIQHRPGLHFLAFATDGNDNIPQSAGAYVHSGSWQMLLDFGCDPEKAIAKSDSYNVLKAIDAILPANYTGSNVNEVYLLAVE